MRTRSLILLVLLVTLTGCIVTYRDFPNATLESLPKDQEPKPLYYHVEPIITQYGSLVVKMFFLAEYRARSSLMPGFYAALSGRSHRAAWVSRGGPYVDSQWDVL